MHDTLKNLFYNALVISDYGRKTITEIGLEKMSGLNKNDIVTILKENENIFNYASLMKNFCPICHKQLVDTQTGFCGGCGTTIDMSNISQYQIDINKTGFIDKSIEFLKKIFKEDEKGHNGFFPYCGAENNASQLAGECERAGKHH